MDQPDLLRYVISMLESGGFAYMVVGSLASSTYGEPRMTNDIDIVIDLPPADLPRLLSAFPPSDYYASEDAARQAIRDSGQFNVIHPDSGNKIDFMIARHDTWGRLQLAQRQRELVVPGLEGFVARPEDIIISKMMYYDEGGSEKHLRDIAGILAFESDVDRAYVANWA